MTVFDTLHEECGVFGIFETKTSDVSHTAYLALYALQHRGQESCGIVVNDDGVFSHLKGHGLVHEVFSEEHLRGLGKGNMAIGHVRYSTTGGRDLSNVQPLVIRHIKANMYPDEKLTVSEISKPDSTFGVMYMSEHEIAHITKTVDQVTEFFMKKTNNMTEYDPGNGYLAYLANKQMLVAAQINEVMAHSMQKKEFNGWRIRCKYTVANQGVRRKTEEWFFFDKEGEIIYSSFAIPLP